MDFAALKIAPGFPTAGIRPPASQSTVCMAGREAPPRPRWILSPSPNLPDLESALDYPGICLFEGTNVSVGRGTPMAFQVIGAPWLDPARVLANIDTVALRGLDVRPTTFTPAAPTDGKYAGVLLQGL